MKEHSKMAITNKVGPPVTGFPAPPDANAEIFEALLSEIRANQGSEIPQPIVVIGPCGSGKTTILHALRKYSLREGCPTRWVDGRSVFTCGDIIPEDPIDYGTVVFLDDMDFFFSRCPYDEQWRLRRVLYDEGAPMLVATAEKVLPALAEYGAPFFEGTKSVFIPPVSENFVNRAFATSERGRAGSLLSLLPPTVRSIELARDVLDAEGSPDEDVTKLLAYFSQLYKGVYGSLPVVAQKILNALGSGRKMTLPELRSATGLPSAALTSYLSNLRLKGHVSTSRPSKRKTSYGLVDPLFQLWLNVMLP